MKRIISTFILALSLIFCLSFIAGCESGSSDTSVDTNNSTQEQTITLTKSNFKEYFAIQFDTQNARFKNPDKSMSRSLCDLVVKIDSLTNKELSNVKVELKISIDNGNYHKPNGKDNEFTKTISIPASGSTDYTITIETWTAFTDVEIPDTNDISYEIIFVAGNLS